MRPTFAAYRLIWLTLAATPVAAQFLEEPSPPPPSLKEQALPVIVETISGLPLVDEPTDGANGYIRDEAAAVQLGKSFYWDMQMGSNGVACATCHYHAGADAREKNQLSPGLNGGNEVFDPTATGGRGPNYQLKENDFPFRQLTDIEDRSSTVIFDTDDAVSSAGTVLATFNDIVPGMPDDDCTVIADPDGFRINGINTRRVEPRNTPTVINAAFNHRNFWDGRANNLFNGVDPFGQRNTAARVIETQGAAAVQIEVAFENSSLASQAMGPPVSNLEISCTGRTFPKIGKKLLSLIPLALQKVHVNDSVLAAVRDASGTGLNVTYQTMIQNVFADRFWNSNKLFDAAQTEIGAGAPANTDQYTLTEINFGLFWGLAIQAYERTLISDDAPYDQWAEAPGDRSPIVDNTKGILTAAQMRGMNLFFTNAIGERGNCSTCHQGPAFSTATFPFTDEEESGEFPEQEQLVERMRMGDAVNIVEDLFRFRVSGAGTVGGVALAGTAGSRQMPNRYPATVGGDLTINSAPCKVESYLMNQDRTQPRPAPGSGIPPEPPGPSDFADYSTKDAVIVVSGCKPAASTVDLYEIRIIDGGPNNDTAEILEIVSPWERAPCLECYPVEPVYGAVVAAGAIDGDFELSGPTLYDTAFYNIGVRPTDEDPGVGGEDDFGNPLSITQQWIDQLLGTPGVDVAALKSLNFGRVAEPFNWLGDSVFFPGGMAGHIWHFTHRQKVNPQFGNSRCLLTNFPAAPAPPPFDMADQETCEAEGFFWQEEKEFTLMPVNALKGVGRGDDAVPAFNVANQQAIQDMLTGIAGAFKTPILRNVTLTAPYFHNGGQLTLQQVLEFYNRGGDFAIDNLGDLSPNIHPLKLDQGEMDDLVAFLEALTDERVRCERAPFDHPEIILPDGHDGNSSNVINDGSGQATDRADIIEEVGAAGSNLCLELFLE